MDKAPSRIYRSKAPLRIGLAGGGTDVSPYCDLYGGAILNATLSHYAYATIEVLDEEVVELVAFDQGDVQKLPWQGQLGINGKLDLLKGVINRIHRDHGLLVPGLRLTTNVDAPSGSGLGTSSTLVVAIIGAFVEMLGLPMGEYDIAQYAFEIERRDLNWAGGRQDQYAATFGGVNFMEFYSDDQVIVNPLRIKREYLFELEHNLLLYYTSSSRESAKIIEQQASNVIQKDASAIEAMHQLKVQARLMKEAVLKGKLREIGEILDFGFQQKRRMAEGISNPRIEEIYDAAKSAGATGGKISGAGGGGFMIFYCPDNTKYHVMKALEQFGGKAKKYQFVEHGMTSWTV
jgi:D-glycero-alpha-D-manno-heptose-7-phosphate kinase